MKYFSVLVALLMAGSLLPTLITEAEAKRLGGGRSFGGRPAYNTPYKKPASPARPASGQAQSAQQHNAQQRAALASRGGLWGMLGGLALGGLLGALLFGGAFEGLNFLDLVLFAGIAYLLYRLFTARARGSRPRTAGGPQPGVGSHWGSTAATAGTPEWGLDTPEMKRKFDPDAAAGTDRLPLVAEVQADADFPPEIDREAFLAGAERAYRTLQTAWDHGDLETLRSLTTPAVFAELQGQFTGRSGNNDTSVLRLGVELLELRRVGDQLEATVLYDAILREVDDSTTGDARGQQVREVWHFVRSVDAERPTWFLDGIQQLESSRP